MPKYSKNRVAGRFFTWNLFLRDGMYYADGRHNTPSLGKSSLGTADREEALRFVHRLDQRKAEDLGLAKSNPGLEDAVRVGIADGWERYLAHAARPGVLDRAGPKTLQRYRAVRDKHVLHCASHGVEHWGQVDRVRLREYLTTLSKQGKAVNTLYTEGTLIKQVVIWLIEEKVLPASARIALKLVRSAESDTYCYSRAEVRAMIDLCRAAPSLIWLADAIVALAMTGMRIGELASLRWSAVDLEHGLITIADNRHSGRANRVGAVRTTKGRRSRRVDIHAQLRDVLLRLPHRAEGGYVFRGEQGGQLDPDKVLKRLQRDVIRPLTTRFQTPKGEIGFEHGVVHGFRHFFVTEAFLGGATDGEVRDWVGHRDSRIVERYRHLRQRAAKQTMARLDFLGDEPKAKVEAPVIQHESGEHQSNRLPGDLPAANGSSGGAAGPNGSGLRTAG